jgi:hypothetical protein
MSKHKDLSDVRFSINMDRIKGLVNLSGSDIDARSLIYPFQTIGVKADICRTIVVFLHATFEDVLRTIARRQIDSAKSQEFLNKIPLIGLSNSGRAEKFYLGDLNAHRGKSVDQLIQESIGNYWDRESFGSIKDVNQVLINMGLDIAPFKQFYADLGQMMKRRHRIVHEADLANPKDTTSAPWTNTDELNLGIWLLVVLAFYYQLKLSIDPSAKVQGWFLVKYIKALGFAREAQKEMTTLLNQPEPEKEVIRACLKASAKLSEVLALITARPSGEDIFLMWKAIKSPEDNATDEEARAAIAAYYLEGTNGSPTSNR